MTINPDYLIERKRTKASLVRWKLISLTLIIAVCLIAGIKITGNNLNNFMSTETAENSKDYIARIKIDDIIIDDHDRIKRIEKLANDDKVQAVIVSINSPGGSVVGSEMLYNALRKIAEKKPVVAVMDSVATSGGYMVALGCDHIIAHNGTVTGSIGVLSQSFEITELANSLGVKLENFKSSDLKALPNPTEKTSPEAEEVMNQVIAQVHEYFVKLVSVSRKIKLNEARIISDGRIYSAHQALKLNLIDEIGSYDSAINWLQQKKDIDSSLKMIDVRLKPNKQLLEKILGDIQGKLHNLFNLSNNQFKLLAK